MHRFAKWLFVLAMAIHIVPTSAFADRLVDGVPIPNDAKVVPPSAAAPENQQRFVGAWVGRWGGLLKHILIVESLQPDGSASVIYGWGDNPSLNITRGFNRLGANLSGDTLTVKSSFITATYKLTSATSATASYQRGEGRSQADMVKLDLAALIASGKEFAGADAQQSAMPMIGFSQQRGQLPVIGVLWGGVNERFRSAFQRAFQRGLADAGFVVGENVAIEFRGADLEFARLPALAADLVRRQVDVIFAASFIAPLRAAKSATTTIPIVFVYGGDPVEDGFVASLSRPGGNLTGLTGIESELAAKRLGLLHEMVPQTTAIGFLGRANETVRAAARSLGVELVEFEVVGRGFERAFDAFAQRQVGAVLVSNSEILIAATPVIVRFEQQHKIPTMYAGTAGPRAGGLMSYANRDQGPLSYYQAASQYVARILKGTKPADLPVQQPTRFDLVINLKTAKSLGLTVPQSILLRADEVIE
jgi:putative ABC transport system substrate-binding protein